MNRSRTLYRAFASNLEMPSPNGNRKRRNYAVFGMIAFFGIMLPVSVLMGFVTYKLTELMYEFDGDTYALLSELHILSAFAMIFGLPLMFSVLFFSSDLSFLTALPIKPSELFAARLWHTYKAENVMTSNVLLAVYIGYFIASINNTGRSALNPVAILAAAAGFVATLLIPLLYCSILAMLLMFVLKKIRRVNLYYMTSTVLFVFFAAVFLMSFKDYGKINTQNYLDTLTAENNMFISICNKLFPANELAVEALGTHEVMPLFLSIMIVIALLFLALLLAGAVYREGLYAAAANISGKSSGRRNGIIAKRPVSDALLAKEYKVLMRTQTYRMNCVYANFLWPLIAIVFAVTASDNKMIDNLRNKLDSGDDRTVVIAFILLMATAFIASGLNSIASTSFTREGTHLDLLKYLPTPLDKQIKAKGQIAILFTYIPFAAAVVIIGIALRAYLLILPCLAVAFICILLATVIGMCMDSISPYTIWSDELSALRGNLNCFFNLAAGMVIAALIGCLSYGLYLMTDNSLLTVCLISVLLLLLTITGCIRGKRFATDNIANGEC